MSFRIYHQPFSLPERIIPSTTQETPQTPLSTQLFQDIHIYDYSYREEKYTPLVINGQKEWIEKLIPKMSNPIAIQGLHLILANIGTLNNFDNTNKKKAEDLLADLSLIILTKDTDLLPLLEEQLADMYQLGQCAQGRVTRLWQLRCLIE